MNQVYKFLLYNNLSAGLFQTHPFTVERVHFLKEWSESEDYRHIRSGTYRRSGAGAVNVEARSSQPEASSTGPDANDAADVEALRQELEALQQEIDRIRRSRP